MRQPVFASLLVCLAAVPPAPTAVLLSAQAATTSIAGPQTGVVRGRVTDASGGAIARARVTVLREGGGTASTATTNEDGEFVLSAPAGNYTVRVSADGFADATQRIAVREAGTTTADLMLQVAGVRESVNVGAAPGYSVPAVTSATRTQTPLREVPQSVSVVSRALIDDQRMSSMADVAPYMPGVGFAQGEGNRDTPILRGNSTTADFFVDGVRDDAQYFRDLYNVDRVEALKGPNAMIFGRGGVGGVINRVTRHADWGTAREASLQVGSWNNKRFTADVGQGVNDIIAVRATGVYENSDSYRNGVTLERYGVNPTAAFRLGADTTVRAGYEFFHDARVADRGVSSYAGRPVETGPGTFFGDPDQSTSDATVHLLSAVLEHRVGSRVTVRNRTSFGSYDKFYQNVFPGAVNASATSVAISAYNNATARQNVFNQTDVIVLARTGRFGHTLLAGTEFGRQHTENFRETGYFTDLGPNITSIQAPLSAPTISAPLTFRQSATDADNDSVATVAAAYVQDQMAVTSRLDAIVGLRFDSFRAQVANNRTGAEFASRDNLVSPRLGVVYKLLQPLSLYGSYTQTYLPRAGEQLASLSITNQALDPEEFRNYEVGAKWEVRPSLSLTAAAYRLDRGNVALPDPSDPTRSILVDAQRTRGLEIGWTGTLTRAWSVAGGYAFQDGEITRSLSSTAQAGALLGQLPKHSFSLWTKYAMTARLAGAIGIVQRGAVFTSTDNLVTLPRYTRVDAAVFYDVTPKIRAQLNLENMFDERYFVSAHSNTNITPGAPRAVRLALTTRF